MGLTRGINILAGLGLIGLTWFFQSSSYAQEVFRVSYGGYNETAAPMWVGIEKGFFKKYGIDASMIQVRNGALSVATLVAKEVEAVYPAQSTILSTVSGGVKLSCIGVQSIGGGFWLQTMIILDHLGVDPDKFDLKIRVIGDGQVIAQALMAGNIDVAAMTYGLSEASLKAGFRSLADAAELKAPYQGPSLCALKDVIANRADFFLRLTKGLAESSAFILENSNRSDVLKVLQKNLRLSKIDEAEASYKVLRLMTTLDLAPNPAAYKAVQRIVARLNPKINQVDLDQIIDARFVGNLESAGFLAELRRKAKQ